ncbi:MAG TPA: hypothetical protein VMF61_12265, partial [Candidatus Acidoferrales bacterium]|nr:hypothetical protein [Candidatus Acidoferrales bacterium]
AASFEDAIAIVDSETVDAFVIDDDDLSTDAAARIRAFAHERRIPIVATEGNGYARLGAIASVPKPVLAGDVMAVLERLG